MACSEIVKHTFEGLVNERWFHHGGMPSSHSAFVTSALVVVEKMSGLQSVEFAMTTVFACIVWYDAIFVRAQVGKQAKALNILQQLEEFSERIGHSLMEVIVGIVFGFTVAQLLI